MARAANNVKQSDIDLTTMSLKQATDSVNRYCTCNENICNCCRDFHIPLVQLKGPGCASLQYLQGDNLAVQLSFGDNILTSTIVNGKNPRPVCVPLPGGFTKFCGRVYSIQRDAKNHFKACLGLELQSPTELEATLRVSCFRFGPDGLKLRPAEPLPVIETEATSEEDDDDDFFGLGSDDDDDDDEDDETPTNSVSDASGVDDAQDDEDDEDDLLGFSALLDIFTGDDEVTTRPKLTTPAPLLEFTIPILARPTTPAPLEDHELSTFINNEQENNYDDGTQEPFKAEEEVEENTGLTESNTEDNTDENKEQVTESSNKIVYTARPDKEPNKVKKGVIKDKKKPTVTSTSVNAIHDPEKPAKKPIKDEDNEDDDDDDDILDDDDEDVDDEDDEILDDDDDDDDDKDDEEEDEEDEDKLDNEKHEEHDDDEYEKADLADLVDDDDDDDDEEEDAMLSALIGTGKSKNSKEDTKTNQTNIHKHDNEDYGLGLGFLARERHSNETRQSKITRL